MAYPNANIYIAKHYQYNDEFTHMTRTVAVDWQKSISNIIIMSTLPNGNNICIRDRIVGSTRDNSRLVIKTDEKKNELVPDDTVFWNLISRINWYDTDERSLNKQHIKRAFNIDQMRSILIKMKNVYIPRLRIAVASANLEDLVEENFNNVLAHIIMKGKIFYNGIILLPEVSLYLCDKFYPVYDWLHGN
jgi:hypothetical protein